MATSSEALRARYRTSGGGYPSSFAIARLGGFAYVPHNAPQVASLCAQVFVTREATGVGEALSLDDLCVQLTDDPEQSTYIANQTPYFWLNDCLGYARAATSVADGVLHVTEGGIRRPQSLELSTNAHRFISAALLWPAIEDAMHFNDIVDPRALEVQIDTASPSDVSSYVMRTLGMRRTETGFRGEGMAVYEAIGRVGLEQLYPPVHGVHRNA